MTTNLINGKIYIGQHRSYNIDDGYIGSGTLLKKVIMEYGYSNFKKEVLQICKKIEIDQWEIYWINFYNSTDREIGYNISKGGCGKYNPETINKRNSRKSYTRITKTELTEKINTKVKQELKKIEREEKLKQKKLNNEYKQKQMILKQTQQSYKAYRRGYR